MNGRFKIVHSDKGVWWWSQPGCPEGRHFCAQIFVGFFVPPACGAAPTWQEALDAVDLRMKWDHLEKLGWVL